jgi:hypothetical protein
MPTAEFRHGVSIDRDVRAHSTFHDTAGRPSVTARGRWAVDRPAHSPKSGCSPGEFHRPTGHGTRTATILVVRPVAANNRPTAASPLNRYVRPSGVNLSGPASTSRNGCRPPPCAWRAMNATDRGAGESAALSCPGQVATNTIFRPTHQSEPTLVCELKRLIQEQRHRLTAKRSAHAASASRGRR